MTLHDICAALGAGEVTEQEMIRMLVAVPPVAQEPLPDVELVDALIVNQGPVRELRHESYAGIISAPEVYIPAEQVMLGIRLSLFPQYPRQLGSRALLSDRREPARRIELRQHRR
jgi:hypothetical protein